MFVYFTSFLFGLLTSMYGFMTRTFMFLTGETTAGLDTSLVTDVMDIIVETITKFLGLFTIYPLNLFLVLCIVGIALGFLFSAKKFARH